MSRYVADVPVRTRLCRGLRAAAVATGFAGVTLVAPQRLDPDARTLHRLVTSALTGVFWADTADPEASRPALQGLVAGGLTMVALPWTEPWDEAVYGWLADRGVRDPRLLAAGVAVVTVLAGYALTRLAPVDDAPDATVELDPRAAEVISALLEADFPGAESLRTQLDVAAQHDAPVGAGVLIAIDYPDLPRAVPHDQTWPVSATFTRGGVDYRLRLEIADGYLNMLSVTPEADEFDDFDRAWQALDDGEVLLPPLTEMVFHDETE